VNRDDAYGRSKKQAGKLLADFWQSQGSRCAVVHLPNLFGEFSRPDYNNFTGTFCHQIVGGSAPTVNSDAPVQLMHYGDAADALFRALDGSGHEDLHPSGRPTSVATVATKLVNMHETYAKGTIPALADIFDTQLFNMLRQVMFQRQFPAELKRHADARGSFFECIRSENQGQTSFSTTRPGITRGNHFHFNLVERFVVLSGSARISVRRLTDNHVWHFDVTGDAPCFIDMPTLHTHNITNTGRDDLYTLFWVNKFFNPDDTDTYVEPV
jgi:UDP-2-acetamido-2,6-beta-L-arabino-hexul-4-ose reductase